MTSVLLGLRPANKRLWRAINEDEFAEQLLLQPQFLTLSRQIDVVTKFEDAVYARQLLEHDSLVVAGEKEANEATNHEHQ